MKKYKLFIIVVFFAILIIPMIFINLKDDFISEIDNSVLPKLNSVDNKDSLENYLQKRIGFRENVINIYTIVNDRLFNKMVHPIYDYGKDGYVYFKFSNEEFDINYLDSYFIFVKRLQDYVNERGSYFIYVINPTKKTVQKDYLPTGYNYYDKKLKYIQKKLKELNINYVDNTDFLIEKNNKNLVFNKKYDAGHWNDYGAFYGIQNVFNKIKKDGIISDNKLDINKYRVEYTIKETLPVSYFRIDEKVPIFSLNESNFDFIDISENIMQSPNYKDSIKTVNNNEENTILIFRGSYFNSKEKFISPYFKEVYYVHNYENVINLDYYFNLSNHPDIVMFTGVEYTLSNNYFNEEEMLYKEYNPLYTNLINNGYKIIEEDNFDDIKYIESYEFTEDKNFTNIIFDSSKIDYVYLILDDTVYDFTKEKNSINKFTLSLDNGLLNNCNATFAFVSKQEKTIYTLDINSL